MIAFAGPLVAEVTGVRWVSAVLSPISLMSKYGWQLMLLLVRVVTTGEAGCQATFSWIRPDRFWTSPLVVPPAKPTGSPGHSLTSGSAESKVSVALRSELTTKSEGGMSQHPKP